MIRPEDVSADAEIGTRFELPLPASAPTIRNVTDDIEDEWWKYVGDNRIVVTELPVTTTQERGRDLAAHIDSKLAQPYGYEPPMVLIIRVVGRGYRDIRTTTKG